MVAIMRMADGARSDGSAGGGIFRFHMTAGVALRSWSLLADAGVNVTV